MANLHKKKGEPVATLPAIRVHLLITLCHQGGVGYHPSSKFYAKKCQGLIRRGYALASSIEQRIMN